MSGRWCPHCGKQAGVSANFCENCGVRLSAQTPEIPPYDLFDEESVVNVWRLIAHHERGDEVAEWSRREGVIAIGWGGMGDLRNHSFRNATELTRLVARTHDGNTSSNNNGGYSLWSLYSEMKTGDIVIVSTGGVRVLTMQVTGDYYFVSGEYPPYYEHRRKAEVLPVDPNRLWQVVGGAAKGMNIRRTLIRCATPFPIARINALVG